MAVGYSIALIKLTKLYKPLTITWVQNIIGMLYFAPMVLIMERFEPSNFANVGGYIVPLVCLGVFCSRKQRNNYQGDLFHFFLSISSLSIHFLKSTTNTLEVTVGEVSAVR